jgi:hypothetical protein
MPSLRGSNFKIFWEETSLIFLFVESLKVTVTYFKGIIWLWAHPASYPMGTSGTFPGGKAARACR